VWRPHWKVLVILLNIVMISSFSYSVFDSNPRNIREG
jgi:hypothetical protein